ncbi:MULTISPECIES: toxin glutamine deamidase domain-containing protein [unclassified Nocardia]|uniref:toxin glutamine deamidase domain-containing protein n=1 Tax=unclassified Nocardia TaxID=2637762 RepID=UPI00278BEE9A|nr:MULTISPECIES: toxin glutamine deamidase domain-containing protein [unclassified Nocardia]
MALQFPSWLEWLEWVVGSDWPHGNEDLMWQMGSDLEAVADRTDNLLGDLNSLITRIGTAYPAGAGGEEILNWLTPFRDGGESGNGSLPELADQYRELAKAAKEMGNELQAAKLNFYFAGAWLIAELAWAAAGGPFAPALQATAIGAARHLFSVIGGKLANRIIDILSRRITNAAMKAWVPKLVYEIGQEALVEVFQGTTQEALVQTIQKQGGKIDEYNLGKLTETAAISAFAGGVGGGAGFGLGTRLPTDMGGWRGAGNGALVGAGAGTAGALGAWLGTGVLTGSWELDPRSLTGGALSGAGPSALYGYGAKSDYSGTPETNVNDGSTPAARDTPVPASNIPGTNTDDANSTPAPENTGQPSTGTPAQTTGNTTDSTNSDNPRDSTPADTPATDRAPTSTDNPQGPTADGQLSSSDTRSGPQVTPASPADTTTPPSPATDIASSSTNDAPAVPAQPLATDAATTESTSARALSDAGSDPVTSPAANNEATPQQSTNVSPSEAATSIAGATTNSPTAVSGTPSSTHTAVTSPGSVTAPTAVLAPASPPVTATPNHTASPVSPRPTSPRSTDAPMSIRPPSDPRAGTPVDGSTPKPSTTTSSLTSESPRSSVTEDALAPLNQPVQAARTGIEPPSSNPIPDTSTPHEQPDQGLNLASAPELTAASEPGSDTRPLSAPLDAPVSDDADVGGPLQSGGAVRPRNLLDQSAQDAWANAAYEAIRHSTGDVADMVENLSTVERTNGSTGFSTRELAEVKEHLFHAAHKLSVFDDNGRVVGSETRRFDADPDIAEAWMRLSRGEPLPADVTLLEHELAEASYLRSNPDASYRDAHAYANSKANWENNIPDRTGENYEGWATGDGALPGVPESNRNTDGSDLPVRQRRDEPDPRTGDHQDRPGRQSGGRLDRPTPDQSGGQNPRPDEQGRDLAGRGRDTSLDGNVRLTDLARSPDVPSPANDSVVPAQAYGSQGPPTPAWLDDGPSSPTPKPGLIRRIMDALLGTSSLEPDARPDNEPPSARTATEQSSLPHEQQAPRSTPHPQNLTNESGVLESTPDHVGPATRVDRSYLDTVLRDTLDTPGQHFDSLNPDQFVPGCPDTDLPAHLTRDMPEGALDHSTVPVDPKEINLSYPDDPYNVVWRDRSEASAFLQPSNALYRMDSRGPEIFETGFAPRNPSHFNIAAHTGQTTDSGFVSVSKSPEHATVRELSHLRTELQTNSLRRLPDGNFVQTRYVHEIYTPHGIDVDATINDARAHDPRLWAHGHTEAEVLLPGGVRNDQIYRIWPRELLVSPTGEILATRIGEPIVNPRFAYADNPNFQYTHHPEQSTRTPESTHTTSHPAGRTPRTYESASPPHRGIDPTHQRPVEPATPARPTDYAPTTDHRPQDQPARQMVTEQSSIPHARTTEPIAPQHLSEPARVTSDAVPTQTIPPQEGQLHPAQQPAPHTPTHPDTSPATPNTPAHPTPHPDQPTPTQQPPASPQTTHHPPHQAPGKPPKPNGWPDKNIHNVDTSRRNLKKWVRFINGPGFMFAGRNINCVLCSDAFLRTWFGRPHEAPALNDPSRPQGLGPDAVDNLTGGTREPTTFRSIKDQLLRLGPGAAAMVLTDWVDANGRRIGGHAFAAVNHNGKVLFVDAQTGKVHGWPPRYRPDGVGATQAVFLNADGQPARPLPTSAPQQHPHQATARITPEQHSPRTPDQPDTPLSLRTRFNQLRTLITDLAHALNTPARTHEIPHLQHQLATHLDNLGLMDPASAQTPWRLLSQHDPALVEYLANNHHNLLPKTNTDANPGPTTYGTPEPETSESRQPESEPSASHTRHNADDDSTTRPASQSNESLGSRPPNHDTEIPPSAVQPRNADTNIHDVIGTDRDPSADQPPTDPLEGLTFPHPWTVQQDLTPLTPAEFAELRNYAVGGYRAVNDALRGKGPMTEDIAKRIELLRSALIKVPLNTTYRVSRSTEATDLGFTSSVEIDQSLIGEWLTEPAFMSTAGFKDPPYLFKRQDPVILDILVPEGTPGIAFDEAITEADMVMKERELLLADGLELQVFNVHYDTEQGVWRIQAAVAAPTIEEGAANGRPGRRSTPHAPDQGLTRADDTTTPRDGEATRPEAGAVPSGDRSVQGGGEGTPSRVTDTTPAAEANQPFADNEIQHRDAPAPDPHATSQVLHGIDRTALGTSPDIERVYHNLRNEGAHDVIVHTDRNGNPIDADGTPLTVEQVVDAIRSNPNYAPGTPIRLISCHSGSDVGWAQQIANELNTTVLAPTDIVGVRNAPNSPATVQNSTPWRTFQPTRHDGTKPEPVDWMPTAQPDGFLPIDAENRNDWDTLGRRGPDGKPYRPDWTPDPAQGPSRYEDLNAALRDAETAARDHIDESAPGTYQPPQHEATPQASHFEDLAAAQRDAATADRTHIEPADPASPRPENPTPAQIADEKQRNATPANRHEDLRAAQRDAAATHRTHIEPADPAPPRPENPTPAQTADEKQRDATPANRHEDLRAAQRDAAALQRGHIVEPAADRKPEDVYRTPQEPLVPEKDNDPPPPGLVRGDDGYLHLDVSLRPDLRPDPPGTWREREPDERKEIGHPNRHALHAEGDRVETWRQWMGGNRYQYCDSTGLIPDYKTQKDVDVAAQLERSDPYKVIDPEALALLTEKSDQRINKGTERDAIRDNIHKIMNMDGLSIDSIHDLSADRLGKTIKDQRQAIDSLLTDGKISEEYNEKLHQHLDKLTLEAAKYNDLGTELVTLSKEMAEIGGRAYGVDPNVWPGAVVLTPYEGTINGTVNFDGPETFDIIVAIPASRETNWQTVIEFIECKGVGSDTGSAMTDENGRVEQMTPEYKVRTAALDQNLARILAELPEQMAARGIDPSSPEGQALIKVREEVIQAHLNGRLRDEYVLVHASKKGEITVKRYVQERDGLRVPILDLAGFVRGAARVPDIARELEHALAREIESKGSRLREGLDERTREVLDKALELYRAKGAPTADLRALYTRANEALDAVKNAQERGLTLEELSREISNATKALNQARNLELERGLEILPGAGIDIDPALVKEMIALEFTGTHRAAIAYLDAATLQLVKDAADYGRQERIQNRELRERFLGYALEQTRALEAARAKGQDVDLGELKDAYQQVRGVIGFERTQEARAIAELGLQPAHSRMALELLESERERTLVRAADTIGREIVRQAEARVLEAREPIARGREKAIEKALERAHELKTAREQGKELDIARLQTYHDEVAKIQEKDRARDAHAVKSLGLAQEHADAVILKLEAERMETLGKTKDAFSTEIARQASARVLEARAREAQERTLFIEKALEQGRELEKIVGQGKKPDPQAVQRNFDEITKRITKEREKDSRVLEQLGLAPEHREMVARILENERTQTLGRALEPFSREVDRQQANRAIDPRAIAARAVEARALEARGIEARGVESPRPDTSAAAETQSQPRGKTTYERQRELAAHLARQGFSPELIAVRLTMELGQAQLAAEAARNRSAAEAAAVVRAREREGRDRGIARELGN